ncbi:hypothetical protein C1645_815441 [Glomus cerebriforme]|uniref:Uncharacterized protein n=1 Tax=Glomus cerebriforme TaxID=658196 RepID=A0A397TEQ6_9GLOM|nr:hypothetical protein C1645_815441 [Glomus cerebriforme]
MATKATASKTRKPKTNNYVGILEQFLEKCNLSASSTPEQLSEHAPELDALLPDWMARRCVKVALAKPKHSFSKEKIEALLPDKRKGKLTIEGRAEYCAKAGDFVDIITNHWAVSPKNKDEKEIVAGISRQSTFRVKLAEGSVDLAIIEEFAKDKGLIQDSNKIQKEQTKKQMANPNRIPIHFSLANVSKRLQNIDTSKIPTKEDLADQEPYRTIPGKLRDYGSKHAFRIYGGPKVTPQHLKLLLRIALRQESDRLDADDNYAIGDTESEDSGPEDDCNPEPESESAENDEISEIINMYSY